MGALNIESAAKLKIDFKNASKEGIRKFVAEHFESKKRYNPQTIINRLAARLKLGSGKKILMKESEIAANVYGTIIRARCNAIPM